ncbi:hypothetical protein [Luteimonas terrae]|uniref:Uncharacterized protein n=1 Tax=Luteimonas terrae TaxID=1530191 RepID=A0ABU1XTS3_9GAMM|nr:hypothetical protein [Luteimonas terrae]MDR7192172.1 hypothetical protein [Luteimonas terrae]
MRKAVFAAVAALMLGATMQPAFAQSNVAPQHPGDPGYDTLLEAATAPVRAQFGDAVRVDVERLDRLGRWAFLQGTLRGADGARPDYAGTPYAERAAQGGMSDVYVALLQTSGDDVDAADTSPSLEDDADEKAAAADNEDQDTTTADASDPEWTLVDHSIGPSDVSWLTWPQTHAAPRQLFGF